MRPLRRLRAAVSGSADVPALADSDPKECQNRTCDVPDVGPWSRPGEVSRSSLSYGAIIGGTGLGGFGEGRARAAPRRARFLSFRLASLDTSRCRTSLRRA